MPHPQTCERCRRAPKVPGWRFCLVCWWGFRRRLKRAGYLQPIPARVPTSPLLWDAGAEAFDDVAKAWEETRAC